MASLIRRRLFLAWFSGTVAALLAGTADAKPRSPVYGDTFGETF